MNIFKKYLFTVLVLLHIRILTRVLHICIFSIKYRGTTYELTGLYPNSTEYADLRPQRRGKTSSMFSWSYWFFADSVPIGYGGFKNGLEIERWSPWVILFSWNTPGIYLYVADGLQFWSSLWSYIAITIVFFLVMCYLEIYALSHMDRVCQHVKICL